MNTPLGANTRAPIRRYEFDEAAFVENMRAGEELFMTPDAEVDALLASLPQRKVGAVTSNQTPRCPILWVVVIRAVIRERERASPCFARPSLTTLTPSTSSAARDSPASVPSPAPSKPQASHHHQKRIPPSRTPRPDRPISLWQVLFTNTGEAPARRALQLLGLQHHFEKVYGADFMGDVCKPQPKAFQMARAYSPPPLTLAKRSHTPQIPVSCFS